MTRKIIGALVAGLLIMLWQTLSHTMLQLHASQEQYTPAQDTILTVLSNNLSAKGQYWMPGVPPGTPDDQYMEVFEKSKGKPSALILYNPTLDTDMTINLLRGLGVNLILGFVLVWLLGKTQTGGFSRILAASLAVGFMSFLFHPYPGFIWYKVPGIWTELLDSLVAFGLAGLWLGWWMNRSK
jgi:hypothetical protein